jgi:hypothetical protein
MSPGSLTISMKKPRTDPPGLSVAIPAESQSA